MNSAAQSTCDLAINCGLNQMRDELLVFAAKSGDALAFVELSKRHSRRIQSQVYRIVKNREDAEDVVQEALLRAFQHLNDFEERCRFSSWLTRIAINCAFMSLRKKREHFETSMEVINDNQEVSYRWEPTDSAENPESQYAQREREELLRGAVRQLPPILRQVVQLKLIDGCSGEEVSETLGISITAGKSRLARAKIALRVSLLSSDYYSGSLRISETRTQRLTESNCR
jgi:RNA polymerase sigma-70 factor, ECF subfamily